MIGEYSMCKTKRAFNLEEVDPCKGPRNQNGDDALAREKFGGKRIQGRSYVVSPLIRW